MGYFVWHKWWALLFCISVFYQIYNLYDAISKAQDELEEFAQSVHYRDFTKNFNIKKSPAEVKELRNSFNEINSTFKLISLEKETQFQYLQKVLEIVNTGIISFNMETTEVNWVNDTFKRMLDVPYLKSINALSKRNETLYENILSIKPGESTLVNVERSNHTLKLLMSATVFVSEDKNNKIIALQNINQAIDETEADAWKKLLSVMTHEIMNSIAPISSLADTLKGSIAKAPAALRSEYADLEDIEIGLETIKRRSEGLLRFAEVYRNLNKITQPNLKKIFARELFSSIHNLMLPTLEQKKIELEVLLPNPQLTIELDPHLIEQVLINLVVNASEAVKDKEVRKITLSAYQENNHNVITVHDNGSGIPADVMEKIFVPFFSTKKSGSGIGLSLSKQIMLLHKGAIHVNSKAGEGSVFRLEFRRLTNPQVGD
jgi:nitrogen fixation/metabolism regulation signal transduction histidine kinase